MCRKLYIPKSIWLDKIKWDAIGNSEGTWWEHIEDNKNSKIEQIDAPFSTFKH